MTQWFVYLKEPNLDTKHSKIIFNLSLKPKTLKSETYR